MKQKILVYVSVFSVLLVLFQYVNSKRQLEEQYKRMESFQKKITQNKDSISVLQDENLELLHFNLGRNEDAISYFENKGFNVAELEPYIKDQLYETNEVKGEHPIVPYAASAGRRMLINTVKLLNHKWIIADFTDGQLWGEVFLTYQVSQDKQVTFQVVESFLYPLN